MINAIAIDDEPHALKIIETFCEKSEGIVLAKTFTNPSDASKYLKNFPVDILFLDINMSPVNGMEWYKAIEQKPKVIFTTAYSEFAVEGFDVEAIDYLLKPFSFDRFKAALDKTIKLFEKKEARQESLYIRADYSLVKIKLSEILYIQGFDDYVKIHVDNQRPILTKMTMKTILEKLPQDIFCRIHRSFIVNLTRIDRVKNKSIYIGDKDLPMGNSFESQFLTKYQLT